jgi:hypothetical protein
MMVVLASLSFVLAANAVVAFAAISKLEEPRGTIRFLRRRSPVVRPLSGCQIEQRRLTFEAASERSSGLGLTTCLDDTLAPILPWIKLTQSVGAQIRRAAAESGITQHDMMAPIVEALADLPDELDRRIDARLDKHESRLVQLLERAEKFTGAGCPSVVRCSWSVSCSVRSALGGSSNIRTRTRSRGAERRCRSVIRSVPARSATRRSE